jgi:hypothetical protein
LAVHLEETEMPWDAAPTGKPDRQQTYSGAAIQTYLSMTVLFGMALRQIKARKRH